MSAIISPKPWKQVSHDTKRAIEGGGKGKGGKSFKADGANVGINRNPSGSQYENGTSGRGAGPHRDKRSGSAVAWDGFTPDISAHPARKGRNARGSMEKPVSVSNAEPKVRSFKGANAGPGGKTRFRPGGGNR
jgi:hypothetical protein